MAQAVDLGVDAGVFFNVGIAYRQVGFRLIIVVIRHKIMHGIGGEERAVLLCQLSRKCLVVSDDQGRLFDLGNNVGNGKRLPRTGNPQERLSRQPAPESVQQPRNRLRLVAVGRELGLELKLAHRT